MTLEIAVEGALEELSERQRAVLLDRTPEDEPGVAASVRAILSDVRARGDAALRELAERFDGVALDALEVPGPRWLEALAELDPEVRSGLERAVRNVDAFHRALLPDDVEVEVEEGVVLGRRWVPLDSAGVYAPGGRAAYPSSVVMGVVPARVAGVREIVVCAPPGPGGEPPPAVLAAAALAGADRVFAVGGAGAVAAMAFGTASVPRCSAVVGPGNRWVLEAKRQVAGRVLIDAPAGPSELLVVADGGQDATRVAAELLAQAEHDPDAAVALVTPSRALLDATREALARLLEEAPRRETARAALARRGGLILAKDMDGALDFAEAYAAEHLALYTSDARGALARAGTAGTVFLGSDASVAHGDYMTGANHVLPTGGASRAWSGLSTLHFLRSFTWQSVSADAARDLAGPVATLAEAEGLPAHAAAARLRGASPRTAPRRSP